MIRNTVKDILLYNKINKIIDYVRHTHTIKTLTKNDLLNHATKHCITAVLGLED
jgi:hypothetical protein